MSKTISASRCSTLIEFYVLIAHCLVRVSLVQCMCQKGIPLIKQLVFFVFVLKKCSFKQIPLTPVRGFLLLLGCLKS